MSIYAKCDKLTSCPPSIVNLVKPNLDLLRSPKNPPILPETKHAISINRFMQITTGRTRAHYPEGVMSLPLAGYLPASFRAINWHGNPRTFRKLGPKFYAPSRLPVVMGSYIFAQFWYALHVWCNWYLMGKWGLVRKASAQSIVTRVGEVVVRRDFISRNSLRYLMKPFCQKQTHCTYLA